MFVVLGCDVPDPNPGDLRVDPNADLLPADYVAPAAFATLTDIAYGADAAQRLDLYLPEGPSAPVVLFLHSGGWVSGTRAFVPEMVARFVDLGYAVAAVDYRLAPEYHFPAPVEDVKRAIRWLKVYGQAGGLIDGDRIVAYGISSGGHLGVLAAATPGLFEPDDLTPEEASVDSTLAGVVSVVGPTDLVEFYDQPHPWARPLTEALLECSPCTESQLAEASPQTYLHPALPPAYWVYGELDGLVDADAQGAAIASDWGEQVGTFSSWWDLVDGRGHNLDHTMLNQRFLEAFVGFAAAPT